MARRAMLRRIVGSTRAPEEEYVTWITRTTRKSDTLADAAGVLDWNEAHCRKNGHGVGLWLDAQQTLGCGVSLRGVTPNGRLLP